FGQHGYFRAQFITRREVGFRLPVLVEAFIAGQESRDARLAIALFIEKVLPRELREEVYALRFDQSSQPLYEPAERHHIITVILQWRRGDRQLPGILGSKVVGSIVRDAGIERRTLLEIREQFAQGAGIENRAGELVRADFARFLEHVNIIRGKRGRAAGTRVL